MAYAVESRSDTPANALREALSLAERKIVSVNRDNVESLLLLLDDIDGKFDDMSSIEVDLRPEEGRWQSIQNRIVSEPAPIVNAANRAGGMDNLRAQHPPAVAYWWHLDAEVGRRRRKSVTRFLIAVVATISVIALILWGMNTFFPPDPNTMFVLEATTQVESLVLNGDWEAALAVIQEARESLPDDPELMIWEVVLSEQLGRFERAGQLLAEAEALFEAPSTLFWVTVGNRRLMIGNIDLAERAALHALELEENAPQAIFLTANVAESRGDRSTAIDLYNQTFDLAEDSDPQLAVIAKVRMGQLLQQVDPFADAATATPETTPTP